MNWLLVPGILLLVGLAAAGKDPQDCEVCIDLIEKFYNRLTPGENDKEYIKKDFLDFCQSIKDTKKGNRFCYYVGGLPESATSILNELSRQFAMRKPALKICQELKSKDAQICELRNEKVIDWNTVDLHKMKPKELRKILSDWDEECQGCIEKADYISKILEKKDKHVKKESREEL